ncbi:MAG: GNAT family N-acetyltransferase [Bacteroidales bacterium]|nr:GNAT family N-acetyltransferase [Bacteroidales bacterium]MCM1147126.1 GNAT family N-acetyltransferase [Bacteroidales bacterium]MCM1205352.1 GNAT family N-acetyltransferase [Bacillota bacterium]MCM1509843.1 GNAT family N-acetyltransferase [Clostridium sp.]
MNITIRDAVAEDAGTIAEAIVMAIGKDLAIKYCGSDYPVVMDEIIRTDGTQFSYHNALIASIDNIPAGAIIGYDGGSLKQLKEKTFSVINKYHSEIKASGAETGEGEFYLDAIGILPQFRGCGIGCKLLTAMCDKAFSSGHKVVGLSVDDENPNAEKLYRRIGFKCVGEQVFLGHTLKHLQIQKEWIIR